MDSRGELRSVVEERIAAVTAKDPERLAARQHPDIVTFNVLPPLHARGSAAVEEATRAWFDGYASDIGYEVRDLHVTVDGTWGSARSCTTSQGH
jgi:ketosteroid isomerase-like protein